MTDHATLIPLLIILALGLLIPELMKKLKVPFVAALILIGALVGPNFLGYVHTDPIIHFFGFLGMTFLMFMAGLGVDLSHLKQLRYKILVLALLNGLIPFGVGFWIARYFGYSWTTALLLGTIFISSSVAIIIPSLRSANLLKKDIGQLIISTVVILDIISLVILAFILQKVSPITKLPLTSYFIIIIISVVALFYSLPDLANFMMRFVHGTEYEKKLRLVIVILIGVVAYFSLLGVHPILAAFIIGVALSTFVKSKRIFSKLHTIGYGLFVPVFFFIIGMEMDFSIFSHFDMNNVLMMLIIFGLIFSKFISGYIGGRLIKLSKRNSSFFGIASSIQITTTLAVTYVASSLGILDSILVTSIILMSLITTFIGPILLKLVSPYD